MQSSPKYQFTSPPITGSYLSDNAAIYPQFLICRMRAHPDRFAMESVIENFHSSKTLVRMLKIP
jgi:hypothetical protein